ncbi:RinA family protein [Lactococcus lactis]|uniref:RinA family protein n=1 Tax=Lactococcus lactis TaxID=1358 RepID=UPI002891CC18|nr:RinA family protein [Lactococcus lactis]MDT2910952.1 RinA family protein [Lactococcus lactis]
MKDKIDKIIADYINGRAQTKIKAIESRYLYRVKQDNLGIRTAYKGTAEPEGNTLDKERMEEDKELIGLRRTLELIGALYNTLTVSEKRIIELRCKGYDGFTWYRVAMELENAGIDISIKRAKRIYFTFKEDVARVL